MTNLYIKSMRKLFDIAGVLDEYRLAQLKQLGSRLGLGLLVYLVMQEVGLLLATNFFEAGGILTMAILLNGVVLLTVCIIINRAVRKLDLRRVDVTAAGYARYLRRAKWRSTGYGLFCGAILVAGYAWGSDHEFMGTMVLAGSVLALLTGYDRYTTLRNRCRKID
ncbi:MAG TPA: DUF3278 domain-containing protein [Candidatus Levilactobacillus faecigallinarum]|uniref:DUF3278 domain-containing protein n=1 Tax=Candidatus Levilactobacillus faecigallinarum TaxID=2838638 RepID=A0A9D1QQW0_9LACO|nr:DUF3278 domain-containing protein [Candidatus Levilactobacillus faecigallinarum]